MNTISYYFNLWRTKVLIKHYDDWCEDCKDELLEQKFAMENDMDPIYWCWNCKYNECELH